MACVKVTIFAGLVRGGREGRPGAERRPCGEIVAATVGDIDHEVIWCGRGIPGAGAGTAGSWEGSVEPRSEVLNVELDVVHDAAQRNLVFEGGLGLAVVPFACVIEGVRPIVRRVRRGGFFRDAAGPRSASVNLGVIADPLKAHDSVGGWGETGGRGALRAGPARPLGRRQ